MKQLQNTRFAEVLETLNDESKSNRDYRVPLNRLVMGSTGEVAVKDNRLSPELSRFSSEVDRLEFSEFALGQMFTTLGIPVTYGRKLMEESKDLVARQFNLWARKSEKQLLIRAKDKMDGTGLVRGVLSDKYVEMDNTLVTDLLYQMFKHKEDSIEIVNCYTDDLRFHLRVAFPELSKNVGKTVWDKDDIIKVGVDIVNSEVGCSSLQVTSMLYRLVCTNGLKRWEGGDFFKQKHIGRNLRDSLGNNLNTALRGAITDGVAYSHEIIEAKEIEIPSPLSLIEELKENGSFTQDYSEKVKDAFKIEPSNDLWGLVNAVTRSAQQLPNERRLEMEVFAGKLLKDRGVITI